jgi:hypothetical protein
MQISLRTKILLGVAAAIAAYLVAGPGEVQTVETARSGSEAAAVARTAHPLRTRAQRRNTSQTLSLLAHRVSGDSSADSLFAAHSWYTPPPPPPAPAPAPALTAAQEAALRAPVAPALPFAFMGSYTPDGSEPVFFLTKGDRVYNVRVGDTLDETYSVDSLSNGQLLLTYKPLQIQQQLTIGGSQ